MCSWELLELLEHLPDTSAVKTALRFGDFTPDQYRQARMGIDTAYARVDGVEAPEPDVSIYLSPIQQAAELAQKAWMKDRHAQNLSQLTRKRKVA